MQRLDNSIVILRNIESETGQTSSNQANNAELTSRCIDVKVRRNLIKAPTSPD
jgi:hypothetical protein